MKLVKNLVKAVKEYTKVRSRRQHQGDNRKANTFGLTPIPNITRSQTRQTYHEYLAAEEQLLSIPLGHDLADLDHQPGFDTLDNPADHPTSGQGQQKPKGSNAWPWNKKLACCGLREGLCECGEKRRYV